MVATECETGRGRDKQKSFYVTYGKNVRSERPNVGGVSRSRSGAPARKGCVVDGQMTKASNKCLLYVSI